MEDPTWVCPFVVIVAVSTPASALGSTLVDVIVVLAQAQASKSLTLMVQCLLGAHKEVFQYWALWDFGQVFFSLCSKP